MMKRTTPQEVVEKFSAFVNIVTHDKDAFAEAITKEHRFLQYEMFECMLKCMEKWAENYELGFYDDRNEYACKSSKAIIDALKEKDLF